MRIALATDWFAPRRGGIESQLLQLSTGLTKRGNDVDVLTSTPGAVASDGFRVRDLSGTAFGMPLALSPWILAALHRELQNGYDVVHAHVSVVSPVGYAAALVARWLGLPTVVTFHSVLRHKQYLLRVTNALADLATSAVVWTAVSELVAAQVRAALAGSDVGVLSNGIDLGFWRATQRVEAKRDAYDVTLVSVMRLHRKKRPRALLTAFAQASARSDVRARLRIIGDGPEREAMERDIKELGLSDGPSCVEMSGWLSADALRSVHAEADGFVLASRRESFGIAALEAAAAGLPVIAMAEAGSREFLTDGTTGFLCRDDADLARALKHFIAHAGIRSRLSSQAVRLERYDWSAVLDEHERAYRRAMKRAAATKTTDAA